MIIVLLGYMGSGKSSVGRILADKLNYNLIDLDDFIEEKEHLSVKEIFRIKGEVYFRKQEAVYLKAILKTNTNTILALGGGTPCFAGNMEAILATPHAHSIYLKGTLPYLSKKLFKKKAKRPLIAHIESEALMTEFIGKHLFERSFFYSKAEYQILTDNKTKKEIAEGIIVKLF